MTITLPYYQTDLAYIHDKHYSQIAESAAAEVLKYWQSKNWTKARLIDLGCGSGTLARLISAQQHSVIGYDYSAEMIRIAEANAPQARFYQKPFFEATIEPCEAVTATGEIFSYLFDNQNNLAKLTELWKQIYEALTPDGLLLFDMVEQGIMNRVANPRLLETPEWTMFLDYAETEGHLERKITIFRQKGNCYERTQEVHHLQLLPKEQIVETLYAIGFKHISVRKKYDKLNLRTHHWAFGAYK